MRNLQSYETISNSETVPTILQLVKYSVPPLEQKKNKELRMKLSDMNKNGNFYKIKKGNCDKQTHINLL